MKARCLLVAVLLPWILWKASLSVQPEEEKRWREIGSFATEQQCQKSATAEYLYLKRAFQKRIERGIKPRNIWFNDDALAIYFWSWEDAFAVVFLSCEHEEDLPPGISR